MIQRPTAALTAAALALLALPAAARAQQRPLERPVQMVAYQIWHRPGAEDRYAPTPELQAELTRKQINRAIAEGAAPGAAVAVPEIAEPAHAEGSK